MSPGYRKSTWRVGELGPQSSQPAEMLSCSKEFRPASFLPTAALTGLIAQFAPGPQFRHTQVPPELCLVPFLSGTPDFHKDFPNQFLGISESHAIKEPADQ